VGHNVAVPGYRRLFGGQLLAQCLVAAAIGGPAPTGKSVRSLHMAFVAEGSPDEDLHYGVSTVREGRSFATRVVYCRQGDRELAVAIVSLHAGEAGLEHQSPAPLSVPGPEACDLAPPRGALPFELRVAGGPALDSSDVGPPELAVWMRPPRPVSPDDPVVHQALLAYCSDGTMMSAAMRPHPGIGFGSPELATTAVTTHTISFHRPFSVDDWLLFWQQSPVAGGGRAYIRGDWFTARGDLVASCAQEVLLRLAGGREAPEAAAGAGAGAGL
jgi:acyl-CoA thioesterase-2